jgi:hypothetical protein
LTDGSHNSRNGGEDGVKTGTNGGQLSIKLESTSGAQDNNDGKDEEIKLPILNKNEGVAGPPGIP